MAEGQRSVDPSTGTRSADVPRRHRPTIVLALRDTQRTGTSKGPRPVTIGGISAFEELRSEARSRGFTFMRDDEIGAIDRDAVVLWDIASFPILPRHLAQFGAGRTIAWSLESPLVAHRAYHRLGRISRKAQHTFLFPGAEELLPHGCTFHPLYWPNDPRSRRQGLDPDDRGFLVMVSSNKRSYRGWEGFSITKPYRALRMIASRILRATYGITRRWNVPDLYRFRLEAVRHFSRNPHFHLFGVGWEKRVPQERINRPAINAIYRGPLADKFDALGRYRFALCFENTIFPGYITEKIFDSLLAGCIPIYLGAPDVEDYIPPSCFIDMREFQSFHDLEAHLSSMTSEEEERRRTSIDSFLASDGFYRFTTESFVTRILNVTAELVGSR